MAVEGVLVAFPQGSGDADLELVRTPPRRGVNVVCYDNTLEGEGSVQASRGDLNKERKVDVAMRTRSSSRGRRREPVVEIIDVESWAPYAASGIVPVKELDSGLSLLLPACEVGECLQEIVGSERSLIGTV
jgi:hypothetical protein